MVINTINVSPQIIAGALEDWIRGTTVHTVTVTSQRDGRHFYVIEDDGRRLRLSSGVRDAACNWTAGLSPTLIDGEVAHADFELHIDGSRIIYDKMVASLADGRYSDEVSWTGRHTKLSHGFVDFDADAAEALSDKVLRSLDFAPFNT